MAEMIYPTATQEILSGVMETSGQSLLVLADPDNSLREGAIVDPGTVLSSGVIVPGRSKTRVLIVVSGAGSTLHFRPQAKVDGALPIPSAELSISLAEGVLNDFELPVGIAPGFALALRAPAGVSVEVMALTILAK